MASRSRTPLEEPPPYIEHASPLQHDTTYPKAEVLPKYSVRPIPVQLTLDDETRRLPRPTFLLKRRLALITLAVLIVVGIVTGYLVHKKKQAEKSIDPPSPILALAACECDIGTFIVTQSNESWYDGFYLTGGVRDNNSGSWTFENEQIKIRNESAAIKGPNYETNLTAVCRVDTDNVLFIHVFYISGIFEISEAIIRIRSFSSPPELFNVTNLANVQDAPSISAIYHSTLGIRLYYLAIPTTHDYPAVGVKQTMLTEMIWTNATGWSPPNRTLSNAHDPGAAFAVCVLDGARLKTKNETQPILNDAIHAFYTNLNENVEYRKWSADSGWGRAYELFKDGDKPAKKVTNMVAIVPTYSYDEPMIFYVSSNQLHQIVVGDVGYFWTQTLNNVPDAIQHPPLIAAVTKPTAHNHEYDKNLYEAPQTQVFNVLKSKQWNRLTRVSHYVTTFLWDNEMEGPGVGLDYVQLKSGNVS